MEEIAYLINNVTLSSLMQYGIWALVPLMLKYYAQKVIKWKEELDEKLVIIHDLQRGHETMSQTLDEHLKAYRERTRVIDNRIADLCTGVERKNQAMLTRLDDTESKVSIIKEGGLAVLSDRLLQSMTFFIKKGSTDRLAQMNIHRLYETYHLHGGNSFITELYEQYKTLPLESEEKKKA